MPKSPLISAIIPTLGEKAGRDVSLAINSLSRNTLPPDEIIVVFDRDRRGPCWARNLGAQRAKGRFLLFSDDDIEWATDALGSLHGCLEEHPEAAYSYGWWEKVGPDPLPPRVYSREHFKVGRLYKGNFISTMSLIRREDFPGFDETLKRLQDYDLWLTLAARRRYGAYCGTKVFVTKESADGITQKGIPYNEAFAIIRRKHDF